MMPIAMSTKRVQANSKSDWPLAKPRYEMNRRGGTVMPLRCQVKAAIHASL